jgi:trimeric autotransporter adhesin
MFIGGKQVATGPFANNITSTTTKFGSPIGSATKNYKGCMASVRLVKSAVYSADFTPADVGSFSSVPGATTPLIELTAHNSALANSNQTAPVVTGTLTYQSLIQSQSALTINSTTATYGIPLTLTTAGGSGGGLNSFEVNSGSCSVSGSVLTPTGAGTCMVTATKAASGNYLAATSSSTAITIDKATPTFSNFENIPKVYGDSSFDLATPMSSALGTWTYSSATQTVVSLTGISATVTGSGTSLITATFTPTDSVNYISGGTTSMTVTVGKPILSVTASSHTLAYSGAIPTITPTYSGFVNGEDASVITGTTCSTPYTTTTAVGIYGSSCTGATASNYSFNYTGGVITIIRSEQANTLTINSLSATYGSTLSLTTNGGSGSGANSFVVDSGPCQVSGSVLTPTGAGTCMVTATKSARDNYLAASSVSTAISIGRKNITISGLTGIDKEYDGGLVGTAMGSPVLVGKVGFDDILLYGIPSFTFASEGAAGAIPLTASGYALIGDTASNYTLSQPVLAADITKKSIRISASDVTVAFGSAVTGSFRSSGLISPDEVLSLSYTYSGTGTTSAPTGVGVYSITPSNANIGPGFINNYSITYDIASLTILAKYTVTYNANGGEIFANPTSSVDYVVGDVALTLPTPTRDNYTFTGWYTQQANGAQVADVYTPISSNTLWSRWVQNSLYGIGANTRILQITTLTGVGNTYSASAGGGTVIIDYPAGALPAGTVIDGYILHDTSTAESLLGASNDYVMSLVLAWVATDGTVPPTAVGKPIKMTVTNPSIRKGARIYSVIGTTSRLLGTASADGSAEVLITEDPQIFIVNTKPDAPTDIRAVSGVDSSTTVSWTAPSDGGSAITSYTVTANTGPTCLTVTTSCVFTGLTNGTAYTFTVIATNAIGDSDSSANSLPAIPAFVTSQTQDGASTSLTDSRESDAKALPSVKKIVPQVSLYTVSSSLQLSANDKAALKKYVSTLKNGTSVKCIGYSYAGKVSKAKATKLAKNRANSVCNLMKSYKKDLKTSIVIYDAKKAPAAAKGAKWVGVSFRVDGTTK